MTPPISEPALKAAAKAMYKLECDRSREVGIELPSWEASLPSCQRARSELAQAAITAYLAAAPTIEGEREAIEAAIRAYFVERTGFTTVDAEGNVSAYYGNWITLSPGEIADAILALRSTKPTIETEDGLSRAIRHQVQSGMLDPVGSRTAPTIGDDVASLAERLLALAYDCDDTDGWQSAAPDVREAADTITRLSLELQQVREALGRTEAELDDLYRSNAYGDSRI